MPDGYAGTLVSVPGIPLGHEGTHKLVVGLIDPGLTPDPASPYNFIDPPRYWD